MKVILNPFTKEVKIQKLDFETCLNYEDIDEWNSFEIKNKVYDIHIHYDSGLSVAVYPVINNKVDFAKQCKIRLKVGYLKHS